MLGFNDAVQAGTNVGIGNSTRNDDFEGKENEMRTKRSHADRTELDWDTYGAHVITTLNALARDSETGAYPLTKQGRALGTTAQFRDWLRR